MAGDIMIRDGAPMVVGRQFGLLTVMRAPRRGEGKVQCRCDCGTEIAVNARNLGRGSRSCGCVGRERIGSLRRRHGLSDTPTHISWKNMIQRCTNPKQPDWSHYGGRGISVCTRWRTFDNFLADMGVRPVGRSIDRINVDGNYEPGNCRWATQSEQVANRRPATPKPNCKAGHAFTPGNTRINGRGDRVCRTCDAARARAYRERSAVSA